MIIYLDNMTKPYICVFDIEHDQGKLLQFAGIMLKNVGVGLYQVCRNVNFYIKQGSISNFITEFTDLTEEFLNDLGITEDEAVEVFNNFVYGIEPKNVTFISHGVHQDSMVLKDNNISIDKYEHLCTYNLARSVLERNNNLTVGDLSTECGCVPVASHNAYSDAISTLCVLSYLLKKKGEQI